MQPVTKLNFWIRPALIVALWIVAAAFTLSELATAVPLITSISEPGRAQTPAHGLRARTVRTVRAVAVER
jgi:hypothetical protein